MKRLLDLYTIQLIKENAIYFLALMIFLLLAVLVLPFQIKDFSQFKEKNQGLTQEIVQLEQKRQFIASFDTDEIERLVATLNTILPQEEDYFSVVPVFGTLSQRTGFNLTDFTLPLSQGSAETLSLNVAAEGTPETFINFLEQYQYQGGRLITMDKVIYAPGSVQNSVTLNFHTKKIEVKATSQAPQINKTRLELIRKISDDLSQIFTASAGVSLDTNYTTRENPFGPL